MPSYPIPSCPVTILGPNANGFSLEQKKHKVGMRTEMGSTRMRVLNTSNVYVINCEFSFFTTEKFKEFLTWLKYETNYGNLWFKADWFDEIGFTAGEWIFKFVELPFSNTGYSQTHNATLLMAPYNDNVVSGDYTELGMGGEFIDEDFPFGFEEFQCTDLTYYRIFRFNGQTIKLGTIDWNESNWTVAGNEFSLSATVEKSNVRSITAMRADHVAVINGTVSCKLGMYIFDGTDFTLLGTETVLAGYSTLRSSITRISDTRIILADGGLQTVSCWEFNYGTNVWALIGTPFSIASYMSAVGTTCITAMSSSRIALIVHNTLKLVTIDFNGSTFSQVGNVNDLAATTANASISAMSASEIVLTSDVTLSSYQRRMTKFSFDGSDWTGGTPSAEFANGGIPRVAMFAIDKVVLSRSDSTNMGVIEADFNGTTFVENGVFLTTDTGANSNDQITSFFIPE